MAYVTRYLVNHLLTFSLQDGEVQSVEEAQARLSSLARGGKIWSQQMVLEVGSRDISLRDVQSQDELERYSVTSIHRCEAINTEKRFSSLLLLVCQRADQEKPDIIFFNCEDVKAEQICNDITGVVSAADSSRAKARPEPLRILKPGEMMDPYGIPSHPLPHAPNPPPAQPPPYPGPRANGVNGGPDVAFLRAERDVAILNHCFDDMESFLARLQQTAEAALVLNQKKKKKKKSKKQSVEDDLLMVKAQSPPEEQFIDIFQKFKYCFSLLARLKSVIANPSSEDLVHHLFKPLDMIVKSTNGPALAASVVSPAMTTSAVAMLQHTLGEEERQLWTSLGNNWTLPRSQLRGPVASYTPVFLDGWKPEGTRVDGQVWEDPVESEHKNEALRVRQEQHLVRPSSTLSSDQTDGSSFAAEPERLYRCSYDFVARNSSELSVMQGDTLEVVESSKRWWKCRNRFDEIGFVPFNILEPLSHIESPVTNKPPKAPAPPPLAKTFSVPGTAHPAAQPTQTPSPQRPRSMLLYGQQHIATTEDSDKVMQVNDELLQRLTNGKANLNKPLVIPRSSDCSVPLDYHSPPDEVADWLRGKGFSEPTVCCLGVLTGAQLFSLNKEELRAVIPEEGARVYSQLTVQKSLLEDARKTTELEEVMEKQKMKVDLKMETGTLENVRL